MATTLHVTCITKRGRHYNPHERIQAIGGGTGTSRWRHSEDAAIQNIESGNTYTVTAGGRTVKVVVATHNGRKYQKPENDGYSPDNLLSQEECS
jgi:outer membrane cobalamin receptor